MTFISVSTLRSALWSGTTYMNLNKVFILGRVTQDLQAKSLPSGQTVTNFSVATNRVFYDKTEKNKNKQNFIM